MDDLATWARVFSAIGTFVVAFVAAFQPGLHRKLFGPRAKKIRTNVVKTPVRQGNKIVGHRYYLWLILQNEGRSAARDVEVWVSKMEQKHLQNNARATRQVNKTAYK